MWWNLLEKLKVERTVSESTRGFILMGCAKGLLLMLIFRTSDSDMHLWNPGLEKFKPLPSAHAPHKYKISWPQKCEQFMEVWMRDGKGTKIYRSF